jgi:Flp pilus assembly protein TadB
MTTPAVVLGCLGLALALTGRRDQQRRLGRRSAVKARVPLLRPQALPRIAAAGLGLSVVLVVGGPVGIVAGVMTFVGTERAVRALEPAEVRRRRELRATELPLVLDLLAVCLRAGTPLVTALETVAAALPGPFSADLTLVAGLQRLGCGAAAAWADLADDPDLGPVSRAVSRSAESGARLAAAFERVAADRRSALVAAGEARARRAGVAAMAPLGLCFLPAFVSLGIVPIVLSLAQEVLP